MTGTPMQNNFEEFFSMVDFVKPKFLGNWNEFSNAFSKPISDGIYKSNHKYDARLMNERSSVLHQMLDLCIHRLDASVLKHMIPPKEEYVLHIRQTAIQLKLYEVKCFIVVLNSFNSIVRLSLNLYIV